MSIKIRQLSNNFDFIKKNIYFADIMSKKIDIIQTDNTQTEFTTFTTEGCVMHIASNQVGENIVVHNSTAISRGNTFIDLITGEHYGDAIDLLITAVNNRTRERNFFKLYCDLLDQSITEEEFNEIIDNDEDNYIVSENENPEQERVSLALNLSKRIKNINSINDFSSIFSFNQLVIEQLAIE